MTHGFLHFRFPIMNMVNLQTTRLCKPFITVRSKFCCNDKNRSLNFVYLSQTTGLLMCVCLTFQMGFFSYLTPIIANTQIHFMYLDLCRAGQMIYPTILRTRSKCTHTCGGANGTFHNDLGTLTGSIVYTLDWNVAPLCRHVSRSSVAHQHHGCFWYKMSLLKERHAFLAPFYGWYFCQMTAVRNANRVSDCHNLYWMVQMYVATSLPEAGTKDIFIWHKKTRNKQTSLLS